MGEIADDMISGRACSLCGVYFIKEHGFPVLCEDCFEPGETPMATEPLISEKT